MTSPLSFSLRLCPKCLKRLLYDCQCLLTHVCLLCTGKVCRWKKNFLLLADMWFSLTIHFSLPVSEVSYNPLTSNLFFFLLQLLHSHLLYVKPFLIDTFQHWLLYNKLSSNNNNNNHHYVSVIQVCVSELTTYRVLILYNTYVVTLIFADTDVNSVLWVNQQQLALYAHFSQTMVILALSDDNVSFIQNCITLTQIRTHQLLYINAILIQSQSVLISVSCSDC